jgi:hypothetical protein
MKKKEKQNLLWLQIMLILFTLCSLAFAFQVQSIIENPEKPLNKNAGRIIQLKEILRIKDEGRDFYFKEPWGIDVAVDGSIFVKDKEKLYKFDASGRFEKNMAKKGQGPGEITTEIGDIIVKDNEIIFPCATMNKVIKLDTEGNFVKEVIPKKRALKLIAYYMNKYFIVDFMPKSFEMEEGYKDIDRNLFIFDEEGNASPTQYSFPVKHYWARPQLRAGSFSTQYVTRLHTSKASQKYIYICHTQDYLIKQFDLEKLQISKVFRRVYPRVKFNSDEMRPFKFYNDVYRLLIYKGNVWALTSTLDKEKGILVDVFSEEGKYLDNFYLPLLNSKTGDCFYQLYFPMVIKGDYLYAIEHDEDWNFYVAKYEIINGG